MHSIEWNSDFLDFWRKLQLNSPTDREEERNFAIPISGNNEKTFYLRSLLTFQDSFCVSEQILGENTCSKNVNFKANICGLTPFWKPFSPLSKTVHSGNQTPIQNLSHWCSLSFFSPSRVLKTEYGHFWHKLALLLFYAPTRQMREQGEEREGRAQKRLFPACAGLNQNVA